MTLEQIKTALGDRNLAEVGRRLGVSRAYLNGIRDGSVTALSHVMLAKLSEYLNEGFLLRGMSKQYDDLIGQIIDCINLEWEKEEGAISDEIYYSENNTLIEHIANRIDEIRSRRDV
tara:strand:+ start:893 stop:1243 length:351 start_codon:yes stop_codon:yes gene_type:complete